VSGAPDTIAGQEPEQVDHREHGLHDAHGLYDNELSIFVGNTNKGAENSPTLGLDYVREITHKVGAGIFFDWAANHHERSFIVGVPLFYKPFNELTFVAGPGVEREKEVHEEEHTAEPTSEGGAQEAATLFLVRLGALYPIHLGARGHILLTPQINWDITSRNNAVVVGAGVGIAF